MIDFAPRFAMLLAHIDDAVNLTSQLRTSPATPTVVVVVNAHDGTPVKGYFTLTSLLREIESLLYALAVDLEVARGVDDMMSKALRGMVIAYPIIWPHQLQRLRDEVRERGEQLAVTAPSPRHDPYSGFPRAPIDEAEREAVTYGTDMGCSWTSSDGLLGCNRLLGHDGDHIAVDVLLREILARWPRESTP